uniref:TonB-dependent receptor SusC n=1 Tax=Stylophora pistillata TaxID=50429 RepID=A0A2B4RAV1_STYPI
MRYSNLHWVRGQSPIVAPLMLPHSLREVKGSVVDNEGEPLPGVLVKVKGAKKAVQTDFDGNFKIKVKDGDVLAISYMGMKTTIQEVKEGKDVYNVSLSLSAESLDDVVVTAYGSQSKTNLATTSSTVESVAIENRPVVSLGEALQGLAPGLIISPSSVGGVPGAGVSISIRGTSSINGGTTPLILVDGMEMDIEFLDPNDIESVTVLEDIASSSVYGARGSRGVIVIKTKSGAGTKPRVQIRSSVSSQNFRNIPNKLNSVELANAYNDVAENDGADPYYSDDTIEKFKKYINKKTADPKWRLKGSSLGWLRHPRDNQEFFGNVDHFKEIFKMSGWRTQQNVSVSGGLIYGEEKDKKINYKLSGNFFQQGSMIRKRYQNTEDYYFKRRVMGLNLDSKPVKWATFGVRMNYTNYERSQPLWGQYGPMAGGSVGYERLFEILVKYHPYISMQYDGPGNKNTYYNGDFATNLSKALDDYKNLQTVASVVLEPIKNWKTTFRYRHRITNYGDERYIKKTYWYNIETNKYVERAPTIAGSYRKRLWRQSYNSPQLLTQYENTFGDHYIKVFAGAEQEYEFYESLLGTKLKGVTDKVQSLDTSTGKDEVYESKWHWATRGVFGSINYTFGKRYVLNASIRHDGSSKFKEGNRWGTFYSYALAYNVSNEPAFQNFFEDIKINDLKLKFSSGQIGNQDVGLYTYVETLGINQELAWLQGGKRDLWTSAPGLVNEDVTWETKTDTNYGIELTALDKRLYTQFTYYKNVTKDMLGPAAPLPSTLGASSVRINNSEMTNTGFTASVTWKDKIGQVSYELTANFADNVRKITKYYNPKKLISSWYEGQVFGEIWGYETVGIMDKDTAAKVKANSDDIKTKATDGYANQRRFAADWSEGDIRYKDENGDGKIDWGDNTVDNAGDRKIIGNTSTRYRYSLDSNISWNGFRLRMFFQGVGKRDIDLSGNMGFNSFNDANIYPDMLDYWREDNKDAFYPKPYFSSANKSKNRETQSRYIVSGAYLRLKNLTLSYSLKKDVLKKIGIHRASLIFSTDNIFTIQSEKLPSRIDPELTGGSPGMTHPLYRTYSLDKPLKPTIEETALERISRKTIVENMVKDIDKAIANMKDGSVGESDRINKYVALALKARFCLYEGTWEKHHEGTTFGVTGADGTNFITLARDAADEIIKSGRYELVKGPAGREYVDLFNKTNYAGNKEVIFWGKRDKDQELAHNVNRTLYHGHGPQLTKEFVDACLMKNGKLPTTANGFAGETGYYQENLNVDGKDLTYKDPTGADVNLKVTYANTLKDRDPRLVQSVFSVGMLMLTNGASADMLFPHLKLNRHNKCTGYPLRKYAISDYAQVEGGTDTGILGNIIFRYAEVLLIYAEAQAELGNNAQAIAKIDMLRDRVGMTKLSAQMPASSTVLDEVRRERRIELLAEGHRQSDIFRWKAASTYIINHKPHGIKFTGNAWLDDTSTGMYSGNYEPIINVTGGKGGKIAKIDLTGFLDNGFISPYEKQIPDGYKFKEDRDYLRPINKEDILLSNGKLKQNPGYE